MLAVLRLLVTFVLAAAATIPCGPDAGVECHGALNPDVGPGGCPSDVATRVCSGHGRCNSKGWCQCDRGFSGAACSRREYLFACPHNCSAPAGGRCDKAAGRCVCASGRSGDDCAAITPVNCSARCTSPAGRAECVDGACRCNPGFHGNDCESGCPGYDAARSHVCSGQGVCVSGVRGTEGRDHCSCNEGFGGTECEKDLLGVLSCPRSCSGRGSCLHGRCSCHPNFAGRDCSIRLTADSSHSLDTWSSRLTVIIICFLGTSALAFAASSYINYGQGRRLAAPTKG
jgi:syndecan 4